MITVVMNACLLSDQRVRRDGGSVFFKPVPDMLARMTTKNLYSKEIFNDDENHDPLELVL